MFNAAVTDRTAGTLAIDLDILGDRGADPQLAPTPLAGRVHTYTHANCNHANGHSHGHGLITPNGNSANGHYATKTDSLLPLPNGSSEGCSDASSRSRTPSSTSSSVSVAAPAKTAIMAFKDPTSVYRALVASGEQKCAMPWHTCFSLGVSAGAYIAIGGLLSIVVAGGLSADSKGNAVPVGVGLVKFAAGAVFPVGLMLVVMTGSELCTGNMQNVLFALLGGTGSGSAGRRVTWRDAANNLFWSYVGNLAGSLLVAYFFAYLTDTVTAEPWKTYTHTLALGKLVPHWGRLFLKAVMCNVLVGLAIWFSAAAEDVVGKVLGIWWPIFTFVACGYEHSIANMFFIPIAMLNSAPGLAGKTFIGADDFIAHNLLPVTVGNFIGTALLNAVFYYAAYGWTNPWAAATTTPAAAAASAATAAPTKPADTASSGRP